MSDNETNLFTRRTVLKTTAAATAGAALFTGTASATELFQVNFCGCSQICVVAADPSDYVVWMGSYEDDEWTIESVVVSLPEGAGGFCYTIEEAEAELGLTSENEAKIIAVSENTGGGSYVGNPTRCAAKPLDGFEGGRSAEFTGFANEADGELMFGSYEGIEVVRGRCGTPGKGSKGR